MIENSYYESLPVSEARPILKKILRKAIRASGIVTVGGFERMIRHAPASHASATKLPWPLSKLEMHDVAICHFKDHNQFGAKRFTKHQIDDAIEEFLSGTQPNDIVMLNADF